MNDYLAGLVAKARGFQWDTTPPEVARDQEQAVDRDTFDDLSYDMLRDAIPSLNQSVEKLQADHDYVAPAHRDLFNVLHQGDPQFVDPATMLEGYDANHRMLSGMAASDEVAKLRESTRYDDFNTAFAMLALEPELERQFERVEAAQQAQREAQQRAEAAQQGLQQAIDAASDPNADPNTAGPALQGATQTAAQAQQALDAATQTVDQAAQQGGQAMVDATAATQAELDEAKATMAAYGVGPGELQRMSFAERQALTAKLDRDKLKALAALLGQFRQYGDAERRRKIKYVPSMTTDVELGADITKLIPDELTRMAIPEMEDLFWLGYAEQSLLQRVESGPEHAGQGPIIVVCDESGSMGAELGRGGETREMWSKALSMALCDQAQRGKRDFIYIGFASASQQWETHFPGGVAPIDDVITFVEHFFGGGTNYERPLTRARELIAEYGAAGKPKPDVVFITDDDCRVSQPFIDEWQAVKADLDMTCYGIQVGVAKTSHAMHLLCDKTILLTALNASPEGMQELFRTI